MEEGKKLFNGQESSAAMPRSHVDVAESEPFRVCSEWRRAKTIRGVWYLVPGHAQSPFVCEACFSSHGAMRALS